MKNALLFKLLLILVPCAAVFTGCATKHSASSAPPSAPTAEATLTAIPVPGAASATDRGIANALHEMALPRYALGWSLFSFNVGVEIGQMCIVLAVAPLLSLLRRRSPLVGHRVVMAGPIGVILAGAFWFVQRAFLSG